MSWWGGCSFRGCRRDVGRSAGAGAARAEARPPGVRDRAGQRQHRERGPGVFRADDSHHLRLWDKKTNLCRIFTQCKGAETTLVAREPGSDEKQVPDSCLGGSGWQPERARHAGGSEGGQNPAVGRARSPEPQAATG